MISVNNESGPMNKKSFKRQTLKTIVKATLGKFMVKLDKVNPYEAEAVSQLIKAAEVKDEVTLNLSFILLFYMALT